VGSFETLPQAVRKSLLFTSMHLSSWCSIPIVSVGLVLVAAATLSCLAYRQGQPLRSHVETLPGVGTASASASGGSAPPAVGPGTKSATNSQTPSKAAAESTLNIHVEHRFPSGELSVWVDDKLVFEGPLRGQSKKHWNPFRMDVRESETVSLAAGQHRLRVRVRSTPANYEQSETILGSFSKDHPTILQINFERQRKRMRLVLR
jgi:hypothetical protein